MVKKITVFANTAKKEIAEELSKMKAYFETRVESVEIVKLSSDINDEKIKAPDCDLAVCLGGDGTVLTCAGILSGTKIPLLAVNMGTFGYITESSVEDYKQVFEDYIGNKASIVERMRLSTVVLRNGKEVFRGSALNDIAITSDTHSKSAKINLIINGTFAANLKGDGLIVATPTGSTAYNLSAGGPILESTMKGIIINPICSFTLSARPLVVDEKTVVELGFSPDGPTIELSCDGHDSFAVESQDVVRVEKSPDTTKLVKNNKRNSIDVLRNKLGWAGGFNA